MCSNSGNPPQTPTPPLPATSQFPPPASACSLKPLPPRAGLNIFGCWLQDCTEQSAAPGGTDMMVLRLGSWAPLGPLLSLLFSTSMAVSEETVLEHTWARKAPLEKIHWKWSSFFSSVHCYQRKLLHIRRTICKYLNNFILSLESN